MQKGYLQFLHKTKDETHCDFSQLLCLAVCNQISGQSTHLNGQIHSLNPKPLRMKMRIKKLCNCTLYITLDFGKCIM